MEKRTIGAFLAALRKANGMTQRELAERLGVSDKTVSRWERDEGLPDLTLIPVLAEIFGVTCDELLRGARSAPDECGNIPGSLTEKAEKQRKLLLRQSLRRFQNRSWLALGIAACGFLAAAIANLGFLRAILGFFLGAIFYLSAAVCEIIWLNNAVYAVSDDAADDRDLLGYRQHTYRRAEWTLTVIVLLCGATLPLLAVNDAYLGLNGAAWLENGCIASAVVFVLTALFRYLLHGWMYRRGRYPLTEQETTAFLHNRKWKRNCSLLLTAAILVTAVLHIGLTRIWGPFTIMDGVIFQDYDSFAAYMEQDIPSPALIGPAAPAMDSAVEGTSYYDEFGNPISEEEALRETLELPDGTVVCEYLRRNNAVISIRYTPHDDTLLPIYVYTYEDLETAQRTAETRHVIFAGAYCVEAAAVALLYFKKRSPR